MKAIATIGRRRDGGVRLVMGAVLAVAALGGCASAPRAESTSTTSTTSAYTPGTGELGAQTSPAQARHGEVPCPSTLSPNVEFGLRSAELVPAEDAHLDVWAACLNRPVMEHMTVILVGSDDRGPQRGLYADRAAVIRRGLVIRGVDPRRIIVGAPSTTRAGGDYPSRTGVRLELTHDATLRAFATRAPSVLDASR